jgi:hypothetical protein
VLVDLKSGRVQSVLNVNPQFATFRFGETSELTWRDREGTEGFGHLVKPLDYVPGRQYPLVIVQYRSRGFLRGGTGDEYPIHLLSAAGLAVLSFHRPDDWLNMLTSKNMDDFEKTRWKDFRDRRRVLSVLNAGIDELARRGIIDPEKIGLTGLSDGGDTASFALVQCPHRFAAAAVSWTYWNPTLYFLAGPMNQPLFERIGFRNPDQGDALDAWRKISVGLNADHVHTPILVNVSDHELLSETETYADLKALNKPIEMHVFENEYHIKVEPAHRFNIYRRNVQWFEFWLLSREEAEPVDATQYERWRTLRTQRDEDPSALQLGSTTSDKSSGESPDSSCGSESKPRL